MSSQVEQIKERVNIEDIVSSYVEIQRHGSYYRAKCPFHNEKSPSFFISPARGTYHCFGCGVHGDVFSFIQEIDGITFYEALKTLAEKAGIKLERLNPEKAHENDGLFTALEISTVFFQECLQKKPDALEYLHKRGLTDKTIKEFRIGYSPLAGDRLITTLLENKISKKEMTDSGMVIQVDRSEYERFKGRIMFPISNPAGKVIGFSGRILVDRNDKSGNPVAKYINSPATVVYDKKSVLYGYDKAKVEILKKKSVVVVEGQMDLVMLHQAGYANTVAVSGTALTQEHLKLLKRTANEVIFCFDADSAGVKASNKAYVMAIEAGFEVKLVSLPSGKDPADIIREDAASWEDTLAKRKSIIEFLLEYLESKTTDPKTLIKDITTAVLPYVKALNSSIERAYYVKKIADTLGVGEDAVVSEMTHISSPFAVSVETEGTKQVVKTQQILQTLYSLYIYYTHRKDDKAIGILKSELGDIYDEDELREYTDSLTEEEREKHFFKAEVYIGGGGHEKIKSIARAYRYEKLEESLSTKMAELKALEKKNMEKEVDEIMKQISVITKGLEELKVKN